jgi:iron complex outermembrane receptor protein
MVKKKSCSVSMSAMVYFCLAVRMVGGVVLAAPETEQATTQPSATQPVAAQAAEPTSQAVANVVRISRPTTDVTGDGSDLFSTDLGSLTNMEVTSVSKKKESILDAAAAVTVITQDDMQRSGFGSIPEMLRLVPGMDVAQTSSSTWDISARGFNGLYADKLLVLQDGRSLYSPVFAGTYWDTVLYPMADLDRIEVIRGPGATLWGANAVNGVINITSKDAEDTQGTMVYTRGSNTESDGVARYGGKISDNTFYRVYGMFEYNNSFDTPTGGNAGDQWNALKGGFRIDKHASDKDSFTVQGDFGQNRITQPSTALGTSFADVQYHTTGNVIARWNHKDSEDSEFSMQFYYDYLGLNEKVLSDYRQHTVDVDFHDRFVLNKQNEISWGLGYRMVMTSANPNPVVSLDPSSRNDPTYSGFVQDTYTLQPEHWFVTVGTKLEHNNYTGYELQPSARLLWTPTKTQSAWAAISHAVRTPSIIEADVHYVEAVAPADVYIQGNNALLSEQLTAYELGYRVQPTKQVSLDLSAFYNDYKDLTQTNVQNPVVTASGVQVPIIFGNHEDADAYGTELSANLQVTEKWRLTGSYSLLETTAYTTRGASTVGTDKVIEGSSPKNQFQIHSYLDITRHLQLNVGEYYTSSIGAFSVPGYFRTDINVSWQPSEGMSLQAGVQNLFDNHHPEYGASTLTIPSEIPRSIFARFIYSF